MTTDDRPDQPPKADPSDPGPGQSASTPDPAGHGDGEGGQGKGRRRRSRVLVASVVAAVLVVGGGAYLGASALGGGDGGGGGSAGAGASGTPGVLALDGYSEGGAAGIAPGEPNPYGTVYRASGTLPGGPRTAPVYWAEGQVTRGEVARLAKALGVDGTPVAEGQEWQVGSGKDGSGPSLHVSTVAPGAWTFNRYAPGTGGSATPTVDPVSKSVAERAAAPVLKALGQDDAKIDASQTMGAQRVVNADPVVGGLATSGWTIGITVSAQGEVVGGSGQLKAPVRGDSYPVLSAAKTLDLMNAAPRSAHRMGIGGCASPVPLKDRLEAPCGTGGTTSTGGTGNTVVVEDAVFGLAPHASGGRQVLVPSWLFEVRQPGAQDTSTVAHPAVDPRYLASSAASSSPSPQPTQSTGSPTTRDIAVDGYWADGKKLTVSFTGGVCSDYKATAAEDSGQVKITVTETTKPGTVCILIAKFYEQTVQLDRPLGDRKVVDSDGKAIPLSKPGARVPAPSSSPAR